MIRYKIYQSTRKKSPTLGKWYARAVCDETYDMTKLSEHMAGHNTPYSPGVIFGVLKDMISCIKEILLDGKNVKLNDLAIFSVGIHGTGAATLAAYNVNENVSNVSLRARATGCLSTTKLNTEATLKQLSKYDVVDGTDASGSTDTTENTENTEETNTETKE